MRDARGAPISTLEFYSAGELRGELRFWLQPPRAPPALLGPRLRGLARRWCSGPLVPSGLPFVPLVLVMAWWPNYGCGPSVLGPPLLQSPLWLPCLQENFGPPFGVPETLVSSWPLSWQVCWGPASKCQLPRWNWNWWPSAAPASCLWGPLGPRPAVCWACRLVRAPPVSQGCLAILVVYFLFGRPLRVVLPHVVCCACRLLLLGSQRSRAAPALDAALKCFGFIWPPSGACRLVCLPLVVARVWWARSVAYHVQSLSRTAARAVGGPAV